MADKKFKIKDYGSKSGLNDSLSSNTSLLNKPRSIHDPLTELRGDILAKGFKTSGDPIFGNSQVVVKPGENIQQAINTVRGVGGGTVFLKNGTHKPLSSLTMSSNIYIVGENSESTFVDFDSNAFSFSCVGSNNYSTGTLSATHGSTTITGLGTTWTSAMVGRYILIKGIWYPIAAFGSVTSLTIALPFSDLDVAGESYVIATKIEDVRFQTLTIKGSTAAAIKAQYANEFWAHDVNIQTSAIGLDVDDSSNCDFRGLDFSANAYGLDFDNTHYTALFTTGSVYTSVGNGYDFNTCSNFSVVGNFILDSKADGVSLTDCSDMSFLAATAKSSDTNGWNLVSGNSRIRFNSCGAFGNGGDGFKLTATSDKCVIATCLSEDNTGYGINIAAATCDNNIVIGNTLENNTAGIINDDGTATIVEHNSPSNGSIETVTTTHTAGNETYIICNSAGAFTVTLPAVASSLEKVYHIKNINTGVVTVDGNASETIDDQTTQILNQYDAMHIVCDGSEWWII